MSGFSTTRKKYVATDFGGRLPGPFVTVILSDERYRFWLQTMMGSKLRECDRQTLLNLGEERFLTSFEMRRDV
jgi:hypothetical protein